MTDENRKAPFSGTGEDEDWDKALNAWEVPDAARPEAKPEGAPTKPIKIPPPAPSKKAPLYRPPTPAAAAPPQPPREEKPPVAFEPYDDDDQDEATLVAQIPPELLEGAGGTPQRKGAQGSGLGQVFRRDAPRPPAPPAPLAKKPEVRDALLDMLFEEPQQARPTIAPPDEPSVVTSAPTMMVEDRASIPDDERRRKPSPPRTVDEDVPEGSLFDPFAPDRDERGATMRPDGLGTAAPPPAPPLPAPKAPAPPPAAAAHVPAAEARRPPPVPPAPPSVQRPPLAPRPGGHASHAQAGPPAPGPLAPPRPPSSAMGPPVPPPSVPTPSPAGAAVASSPVNATATPIAPPPPPTPLAPPPRFEPTPFPIPTDPATVTAMQSAETIPPPDDLEATLAALPSEPAPRVQIEMSEPPAVSLTSGEPPAFDTLQGGFGLPEVEPVELDVSEAPSEPPEEHADTREPLETMEADDHGVSLLEDPEELAAWHARALFIEEEARSSLDRNAKARGLLIASELHAATGDEQRAHALAVEARDLSPNHPLAHRQARATHIRSGDWTAVTQALQGESRSAVTPAARVHDAFFASEIARVALGDKELAAKRLEQATRAATTDVRAYLNRLAGAIGDGEAIPKIKWPDADELKPLIDACATLQRWRGLGDKEGLLGNPVDALIAARAALAARDPAATLRALEALGAMAGLAEPAGWLGAAIALACPTDGDAATTRLAKLADGKLPKMAQHALVAETLRKADGPATVAALERAGDDVFSPTDRAIIGALSGADSATLAKWLAPLEGDATWSTLAAAIHAALGDPQISAAVDGATTDDAGALDGVLRLARHLGGKAGPEILARALQSIDETSPAAAIAGVLSTELDIQTGRLSAVAEWLSKTSREATDEAQRDHALVAGLLFELSRLPDRARELYEAARMADAKSEAAVRAELTVTPSEERARLLVNHALGLEDGRAGALLLLEAAHGDSGGDADSYTRLLKQSHERAPTLPFAAWLAERRARARGEFDVIVDWLRERQKAYDDPTEQAYDFVREALLIADSNLEGAKELLEQASRARPGDLALRELYERLAPEPPPDKAAFWADRAAAAQGAERARLALFAALEFERNGDFDRAAELSQIAVAAEDSAIARLCAERNEARSGRAQNLAERLMEQARGAPEVEVRIEAYQRLADLDIQSRGDVASAIMWHKSILEERAGFLPSLARLEQWFISEGREDELAAIAAEIAKVAEPAEASAHAHLASRVAARSGPWQSCAEFVKVAFDKPEPALWSLRAMESVAGLTDDAAGELAAAQRLADQTSRPLEVATLTLRAAEAAIRAGENAAARDLLQRAAGTHPTHLIVHRTLGELCEKMGDPTSAAEAWEAVATLSSVPEHQLEANYRAAILWLDQVKEAVRGRTALEAAAQLDITYQDVFTRLQGIYVAASDREALAALLENRLAGVRDPNERIELEVVRGRTLAEIGDSETAKRALAYALEANPDHAEALAVFADVCGREGDWPGAEQALIRLARLVPDTAEQAAIYMRLGEIYDQYQPNPQRAELAYREVLRRLPGDISAQERLVGVYSRAGDANRAIEMQQGLLQASTTPETKRRRVVELAIIYEQVAKDPKRGETMLEAARKEFPNDVELLAALAEFYTRANRGPAVQVLLDRAAGDARRALSTGRFDVSLFAMLGAVARLRQRTHAAAIAEATVAAIEGRSSALAGAESRAPDVHLDDALAPELLTAAFRSLLQKSGDILDAAIPVDLKALRAAPLPANLGTLASEIAELAAAYGLHGLEVFVSPTLGSVCIPVASVPPQIALGQPLVNTPDDAVRRFLICRALKAVQARASAIARSAPIDLAPLISGYLLLFAPDWQPAAVDPGKLRDMHARLTRAKPKNLDNDVAVLALEVVGTLGNRASTLHTVVNNWGNRVALLASGDLSTGLSAIARAAGHSSGPAASGPERVTWIGRNAEARDLAIFSVSDSYAEVRAKLGL
jgi:predicted Zn-dependent protease